MEGSKREYRIVVGKTPKDLENKVNEALLEGYEPSVGFGINDNMAIQPMILKKTRGRKKTSG